MTKQENEKQLLSINDDKKQQSKWVSLIDNLLTVYANGLLFSFIAFLLVGVVLSYDFMPPDLSNLFFLIWVCISFIIPAFLFFGLILQIIKYVIVKLDKKTELNQAA